jgi:hypothetical protein
MAIADPIARYARLHPSKHAAICRALRQTIDSSLPRATSKIWHAIPVWFIGEIPVVGYSANKTAVTLLFWNGQSFAEPDLVAAGKFKAAQIKYTSVDDIDAKSLRRWLRKSRTDIFDYRTLRTPRRHVA